MRIASRMGHMEGIAMGCSLNWLFGVEMELMEVTNLLDWVELTDLKKVVEVKIGLNPPH